MTRDISTLRHNYYEEFGVKYNIRTQRNNTKPMSKRIKFVEGANYNIMVEHAEPYSITDGISNKMARLGVDTENIINAHEYVTERITNNYQLLTNLYRDNWVIQNIVSAVPDTITNKWFNVVSSISSNKLNMLTKVFQRTRLASKINEGMRWGRLYGGALGIIMMKGQTDNLDEPLDYDYIGNDCFLGLHIIDRWLGAYPDIEVVDDPTDPDFGLPKYYEVTDPQLGISLKVHHSKVVRFVGRQLPSYERIRELYWGESDIESVYRELVRRDTTAENIASLIFKANLSVLKVKDLDQIFAINSEKAQKRFWELIKNVSIMESSLGIKVVNSEDSAEYLNYSFTGVREIYETIMMDLAGATRIPVTKLFGRSPAGLNATGESDLQNYYDYVDEVRNNQFTDHILKLLPLIALSTWGEIPDDLNFKLPEMKPLDELQKATIAQQKTATILEAYNTNLITVETARKELKLMSDNLGMFTTISDESIAEGKDKYASDMMQMSDPMAGLFNNIGAEGSNNSDYESMHYDENNPQRTFNPELGKSGIDNSDIDKKINDESQLNNYIEDDIDLKLNDLINCVNESNKIKPNLQLDFDIEKDNNKNIYLKELEVLKKSINRAQKDYIESLEYILSFENKDQIPKDYVDNHNKLKTTYKNILNYEEELKNKIIELAKNNNLPNSKLSYQDKVDILTTLKNLNKSINETINKITQKNNSEFLEINDIYTSRINKILEDLK